VAARSVSASCGREHAFGERRDRTSAAAGGLGDDPFGGGEALGVEQPLDRGFELALSRARGSLFGWCRVVAASPARRRPAADRQAKKLADDAKSGSATRTGRKTRADHVVLLVDRPWASARRIANQAATAPSAIRCHRRSR